MNRFTLVFGLVAGPALLSGLWGCNDCNPTPDRFGIRDYKLYPRKINRDMTYQYLRDTLVTSDTVRYRDLELILVGTRTTLASRYYSGGGSSAWACDPGVYALDSIKNLIVTSDKPFNASLDAGINLATVLTIGGDSITQQPVTAFLTNPFRPAQPFYSLRFSKAPDRVAQHRFTVTADLGKGRLSTFTTRPIAIKP